MINTHIGKYLMINRVKDGHSNMIDFKGSLPGTTGMGASDNVAGINTNSCKIQKIFFDTSACNV